jgi:hypothetical protein
MWMIGEQDYKKIDTLIGSHKPKKKFIQFS